MRFREMRIRGNGSGTAAATVPLGTVAFTLMLGTVLERSERFLHASVNGVLHSPEMT